MLDDADREWLRATIRQELQTFLGRPQEPTIVANTGGATKILLDMANVEAVFDHWRSCWKKTERTKLDGARRKVIERALKSYDPEILMMALTGYTFSAFHNGQESGKVYDEITLHLRDAPHIDAGLEHFRHATTPQKKADKLAERGLSVARELNRVNGHP